MYYLHRLEVPPWHLLLILTQEVTAHAGRHRKQIAHPDHQHEQADRAYPGDGIHEVSSVLQEQDNQLALQGKLGTYLADLNEQAQERLEVLIRQMKRTEGVDERLKARDQQEWIGRMNNIRQRAEESVMAELIFI